MAVRQLEVGRYVAVISSNSSPGTPHPSLALGLWASGLGGDVVRLYPDRVLQAPYGQVIGQFLHLLLGNGRSGVVRVGADVGERDFLDAGEHIRQGG